MPLSVEERKLLTDMLVSASAIREIHLASVTFEEFVSNRTIRLAVEREFTIIGEALANLTKTAPYLTARISHARAIVGFRNILVHAYGDLDYEAMWTTVHTDLPLLLAELRSLLATP